VTAEVHAGKNSIAQCTPTRALWEGSSRTASACWAIGEGPLSAQHRPTLAASAVPFSAGASVHAAQASDSASHGRGGGDFWLVPPAYKNRETLCWLVNVASAACRARAFAANTGGLANFRVKWSEASWLLDLLSSTDLRLLSQHRSPSYMIAMLLELHGRNPSRTRSSPFLTGYSGYYVSTSPRALYGWSWKPLLVPLGLAE
jgi:hypothetical protein